jgi:hypothetical protein
MSEIPAQPDDDTRRPPLLTVVRGEPAADDLAALTVVVGALASRASQGRAASRKQPSLWAAKDHTLRPQLQPGPGAWKASARPR